MSELDPLIALFEKAPPEMLAKIEELVRSTPIAEMPIVPTKGPQLDAYECEADEVFYGGSAGGGKSALTIGLALNEHQNSLLLRRYVADAEEFAEDALDFIGTRDGYNGQQKRLRYKGRTLKWGGVPEEKDKQRYKGKARDLMVFDELPDFLESQYVFITTWNRSKDPKQRCRVVATGNPPTEATGLWVIKRWGPWLDPTHSNPAKSGEIRWFINTAEGRDTEVDGPGEFDDGTGRMVRARSRTFIRAKLDDNPDLTQTDDYKRTLDALPKELRDAYRDGKFDASLKDKQHQVIPTDWIRAAQKRWEDKPPYGIPMCAIGVDGARSHDEVAIAPRYDGYYPHVITVPGKATPHGRDLAALVITHRRDQALPVIDTIETTGAQAYAHLEDQEIECYAYRGNDPAIGRSEEGQLSFYNRRAEAYWRFREALDPEQDGGSPIALPDDPELVADLTILEWTLSPRGIKITSKEDVVEMLGNRSPNKGDAVVMAWYQGARAKTHIQVWMPDERVDPRMRGKQGRRASYNRGPRRRH
ncbi:MAG: terminase family protein [Phycisphaerales bacterium]|nr:terminase family protein [Phycisphaerales bacterium]